MRQRLRGGHPREAGASCVFRLRERPAGGRGALRGRRRKFRAARDLVGGDRRGPPRRRGRELAWRGRAGSATGVKAHTLRLPRGRCARGSTRRTVGGASPSTATACPTTTSQCTTPRPGPARALDVMPVPADRPASGSGSRHPDRGCHPLGHSERYPNWAGPTHDDCASASYTACTAARFVEEGGSHRGRQSAVLHVRVGMVEAVDVVRHGPAGAGQRRAQLRHRKGQPIVRYGDTLGVYSTGPRPHAGPAVSLGGAPRSPRSSDRPPRGAHGPRRPATRRPQGAPTSRRAVTQSPTQSLDDITKRSRLRAQPSRPRPAARVVLNSPRRTSSGSRLLDKGGSCRKAAVIDCTWARGTCCSSPSTRCGAGRRTEAMPSSSTR